MNLIDDLRIVLAFVGIISSLALFALIATWSRASMPRYARVALAASGFLSLSASYTSLSRLGQPPNWRLPFAILGEILAVWAVFEVRKVPSDNKRHPVKDSWP